MTDTHETESIGDFIRKNIYTVRGTKVMLDSDLAEIYGYTTSAFNQQVTNNIAKFDQDFRFQITKEEYQDILKSKNLTSRLDIINCDSDNTNSSPNLKSKKLISSWGGKRKLPYVFTEQGIYMLMTVLKGELATRQSKTLIRTFKDPHISVSFKQTCGIYHDRYIVLDYNTENEHIYHCGASSKDAGNKVTTISQVSDTTIYHQIVDVLLSNTPLTLK